MSQKIDPREVLTYLNELGYTNINAQQLKDFITDLKKLIKHENRRRHKDNAGEKSGAVNSNDTKFCCCPDISTHANRMHNFPAGVTGSRGAHCCNNTFCPHNQANSIQDDVFNHLYSQHTVASRAKEIPRREKHISVHITKPRHKSHVHEHCRHFQFRVDEANQQHENAQVIHNIETTSDGSKLYINTESTLKTGVPSSKKTESPKRSPSRKSSFIRCASAKYRNKSDPVALYHFYQDQWNKQKFPGQEHHLDLRWAVREKLLSGPKVEVPLWRKRPNSWRG
ncbi:hypothetical protein NQ315_005140 [Exocentrus adspersus]|uniref:Centriolar and ciliogenesis-associated protein HYLS1 C-terminal domain-containing protein n=1 Tax=Exocentrus adspersus TaxID=1586481 RepID=A0AAV8VTT4_9CUCU|nr:hypothetical protein NQ315_005140 [Exocentrus adspersus]